MCSVVSQWTNCFIKPMFQICVCACVFMGQTCQGMETTHFKPFKHSILKEVSPGNIHWKDWCWRWNSNTLATWCEVLTHWKRRWCWERLRARGEGDDRGWDGWMASPTRWTWVWASSGSWWWTGRPGVLWFMGVAKSRTRLSDWTALKHPAWAQKIAAVTREQARIMEVRRQPTRHDPGL